MQRCVNCIHYKACGTEIIKRKGSERYGVKY